MGVSKGHQGSSWHISICWDCLSNPSPGNSQAFLSRASNFSLPFFPLSSHPLLLQKCLLHFQASTILAKLFNKLYTNKSSVIFSPQLFLLICVSRDPKYYRNCSAFLCSCTVPRKRHPDPLLCTMELQKNDGR